MPFLVPLLTSRLFLECLGVIALGLLLLGLKHSYDAKHEAIGAARVQVLWDADKAARIRAFSDAMTKYVTAQADADASQKALEAERQGRITDAKHRAANLPAPDAHLRFPGNAASLLDDAGRDSAPAPGPAGQPASSPAAPTEDSTVGLVTGWAVDVIGYYNACRDEVLGWQSFFHALQAAQPEVAP